MDNYTFDLKFLGGINDKKEVEFAKLCDCNS